MRWTSTVEIVPELAEGEVHIWQAALDLPEEQLAACWRLLDADERERAGRFHFERDRRRFAAGRGQLRAVLGRYLATPPAEVAFAYSAYGKPMLGGPVGLTLHFNLAHSEERALLALCRSGPVGVDIERVQPTIDAQGLARHFFAPEEQAALRELGPESAPQAFFRIWACKEAYIKGHGHGLSLPLDSFAIELGQGGPRLLYSRRDPGSAWRLCELEVGAGYTAAVATASQGLRLRYDAGPLGC